MASPVLYRNGFGGSVGSTIATSLPTYALNGGHVWYVSSLTGTDGASPLGESRNAPLKTSAQAITNAVAGDTIVYLAGHAEIISSVVTVNKIGLKLVSEGSGTGAASFTCNTTGGCFNISVAGCELSGLFFPASTVTPTNARIDVATAGVCLIENCLFAMGALDTTNAIRWGSVSSSVGLQVAGCSFVATSATQAAVSVGVVTNAAVGLYLNNIILDGGTTGFSDFAIKLSVAVTAIDARNVTQANNAHVSLAAGCTGTWIPGAVSGGSRFEQS